MKNWLTPHAANDPPQPLIPHSGLPAPLAAEDDDEIDLRSLFAVLRRRRWIIGLCFLLVVVVSFVGVYLTTPIYRATLMLQIDREPVKILDYQGVDGSEIKSGDKDFYQTQYELLKSRALAHRVIDQLGLAERGLLEPEKDGLKALFGWGRGQAAADEQTRRKILVDRFQQALEVEPLRNTRLVRIHFDHPDPKVALEVVNAVAETFMDMNIERRFEASAYAKEFIREQLAQVQAKLEDSERRLVAFAREHEIVTLGDEGGSVVNQRLREINLALSRAEQARIEAESRYQQLVGQGVVIGAPQVLDSPVIQELKKAKARLEAEYNEKRLLYKPAYPMMVELRGRIQELEAQIAEEGTRILAAVRSEYLAAKAKEDMLRERLEAVKQEVLALRDRSIQYNILQREVKTNRELYNGLLQRLKEVGVAGGVDTNNIAIVDPAELPLAPYKPKVALVVLLGAVLGLMGGVLLAFVVDFMDDTVQRPEDLEERMGLPLFGLIPAVSPQEGQADPALLTVADPAGVVAEAYRSLRTALMFATPEGAPRLLQLTSAGPGEGKSTSAVNIAASFAQMGSKVLLIDADLRNPSLHHLIGLPNSAGLSNVLVGEVDAKDALQATTLSGLFVMTSGPIPPNPAEILGGSGMEALLAKVRERFDHVIIDGPPVLGLADALVLAHHVQATLVVASAGETRLGHLEAVLKRLHHAHARILGGVLCKVQESHGAYGGYHAYYYYGSGGERRAAVG